MQAAVLMYVDARAESGAGVAAELPWTRWARAHRDADVPSASNSNSNGNSRSSSVERVTALHKRPSAAAMVLARKRQRKRQQELADSASEASIEPDADEEEEEEEITAFVEYNANDMDSLDINLSQDFDGEISVRGDAGDFRRRRSQPRHWGGSQVVDAEEASEVFDNVIYVPLPSHSKPSGGPPAATTSAIPPPRVQYTSPKPVPQQSPLPEEEDDDALSDGFEVDPEFANALKQGRTASPPLDTSGASANQLVWHQRRSVKRDCSFVDSDGFTDSRCMPGVSCRVESSPLSSIKVVELDDDDNSIESIEACSLTEPTQAGPFVASATPSSSAPVMTSTSLVVANRSAGFLPRLQKKRRKMEHQLTLDGFFGCRTLK